VENQAFQFSRNNLDGNEKLEKNIHSFNRAADYEQCNFLRDCIHSRFKPSRIPRFVKDTEDASTRNNI
jgi:hypothetical protein